MTKMTVRDIEVADKRVLVRVDFNVPLDEKAGTITDDIRIQAALPTIEYLLEHKAKIILCSHLGRPKGKVDDRFRMAVVGQRLSHIIGRPVTVARDCIGPEVEAEVNKLKGGDVLLLENTRFHPEEEKNDDGFAKSLSRLADVYVNDAFGTMHRAHASIVGVTKYLPAVAGLLAEREIEVMRKLLSQPAHPFAALVGGAKVSDKVSMLDNLMGPVDYILVGGGMAATFLRAKNYGTGHSLVEEDMLATATNLMEKASRSSTHILLPVDVAVANEKDVVQTVSVERIPSDSRIVDIGGKTIEQFMDRLGECKTVFWNGPMGMYEKPEFAKGTEVIARFLAGLNATTIIGGGSTAEAVGNLGLADKMTFVSTGGGASLKFLGGEKLPGVETLLDKKQ